jgi:hypothetical protein
MEETQATPSTNRNLILLAAGVLVVALVVIAVVAFVVLGDDSGQGKTAESAVLMPADTWMFFSMQVDLPAAENFDVVRNAWQDVPEFGKVVENWPAALFEDAEEVDYEADIKPWLGNEVAFGMGGDLAALMQQSSDMSFEDTGMPSPSQMPDVILAVATKDTAASDKFLSDKRSDMWDEDMVWQETDYKGVKVYYAESEAVGGVAYATIDDYVVLVSGGLDAMHAVIDAQDGTNLAQDEDYVKTLAELPADSLGFGYMNMGSMMEAWLAGMEDMADLMGPESAAMLGMMDEAQFKAFKGAAFSFGFYPKGIRFDFASTYDADALPESMATTTSPNKILEYAPADALFYMGSVDFGATLEQLMTMAESQAGMGMEDFDESLQMLESQMGLKLEDIYEAFSGEYSLVLTKDALGLMGDPSMPLGALVQVENKKEAVFKQLTSLAGLALMGSGPDMLDTADVNGVEVTLVQGPTGEPMVGWGLSDKFFAMGTNQDLLEYAFGGGDAKLADSDVFKEATELLPKKNTGYFYLNVAESMNMAYEFMSPYEQEEYDQEGRPVLEPIKVIAGASEPPSREKGSASGTFVILLEAE